MSNRRKFIKQAAALTFFPSAIESFAGSNLLTPKAGDSRISLKEPGPMIPPVPAILLTVNGLGDNPPEITVVWTFVINGKPPQIGISVEDTHAALALIKEHKEFVLNVPNVDMVDAFDKIDMNSSKLGDKFKLSGLGQGKAKSVNAPTIEIAPIHVECKVIQELRVPPIRTLFIAEVTATTISRWGKMCDENGKLLVENVNFFGMTAGSGEFYTMGKKVGHIGKSVGRSDIKY